MIRKTLPGDMDRLMEIWLEANLDAHHFLPTDYWHSHWEEVRTVYFPQAETYVWEENGRLEGFLSLMEGSYIGGLFVSKESRGRGIGGVLLEHAKGLSSSLSLDVYAENRGAVRFYERHGFTAQSQEISQGHPELRMTWNA